MCIRDRVKDSFVADCAMAVLKALENCISKEKFIEKMKQFGWNVNWTDKRKHITFCLLYTSRLQIFLQ